MTDRRSDPLLDRYLAPQSRSADPLDDALSNDARTRATTAILTSSTSPDAIARANALSRQTGLPPETVDRNLGAAERQVQLQKARNAMQRYPELASWASDPRIAAMSRDDIDGMVSVARSMRTAPKTPIPTLDATMAEMRRRQAYWQRATAGSGTLTAARAPAPTLWNLIAGVGANLSAMRQGLYQVASDFGNWLVPDSRIGGMPGETREQRIARNQSSARFTMRDTQQAQARVDATTPQFKSQVAAGVYGGVQSFIQQAPGLAASVATGNPAPALLWGSSTVGAQSYGKYRGRGATPGEAALGASGEAAVEYVTEKIPMGFLVSAFGKKSAKGFLTEMGRSILSDIPGEQIATLAQDAIDTAIANPDKTWGQYFEERPNAALQTLVATITQGTITGGMGLVGHTIHERGRVAQANADAEFLSELGGLATESKVRSRDPSAFAKFIEMQSQGTPVEKLYIPGEAIASYLQSNDIDWHGENSPFAFDPSIAGQIDQALATGGDVVIPTSNYVSNLAGTEVWEALADHVRGRADGMSLAEARSYEEDYADEMTARGEEAARISREETQRMSPVNRVYQEVFDQARSAGFNVRAARAYAETWASRYEARAARSPELGNAYDAYRASNVSITQEMPESVTRYRKADQMDVVINAMRRGAEAPKPQGKSLLEFIAARGGIEDRGGDIASMGGDKWHTSKAFRRRLIRPHDDGAQGSMLGPRSASGHGVDDVLQAAIDEGYFPELLRTMDIRGGVDTGTYADKPDTSVLLDAIDAELRGTARYPEAQGTDAAAETQAQVAAAAEDLRAMLESQGVDPDKASREEIDAALKAYGMAEDDATPRSLDQITPDQARELNTPVEMPSDPLFAEAVANTPGAEVTPDGLLMDVVRIQRPEQEGMYSVRTGVFYLPKGSANLRHYKGGKNGYGGTEKFEGQTLLRRPLFVKGATGGKAPEAALDAIRGRGAMKALETRLYQVIMKRGPALEEAADELLNEYGADTLSAYEIEAVSKQGNQLRYALQENIIAHVVREAGYDAVLGYSKGKAGASFSEVFDVREQTYPSRDSQSEVHESYWQNAKGRIDIHGDGRKIIRLFEGRDLSTLLHESGHLWLEELRSDAAMEGASEQLRNDWQAVQDWFAKAGFPVEDGHIPTDAHEMWARGIERYFMEGKAPTSALRSAFEAFKGWLLRIYQVAGNLRTPLTNDVRGVMDRLLATDDAITDAQLSSDARAMFTSAEQAGMTDAEFAAYQESVGASRDEAFDALLYRTMETVRRERTAEWKRERRGVRDEVATQIGKRPEFVALARLRSRGEDKVSLDRTALVEMFGEDALKLVPAGAYRVSGGVHPDVLAETVGLSSGQELMSRLMGIQQRENQLREIGDRRSAFDEAVDVETDEIMRERHGDALTDGSIEEEALAAIHNDRRATILASELRQLARRNGTVPTPWRLAKEWAERTVREGRIAEQASAAALAQHRRAEQKAGRAAEKAMLAGDLDEAFNQKQAQMLNHALWRAAKEAKDEVDAIVRRLGKLAKAKTLPSMDQDYLDRIHDLLEDYDFRARTRRDNAERVAFADWVKAKEEAGEEVYIPPRLADATAMNWSRMTYGDLTSLDDVVASIAHLGRRKKKLLIAQEERDFDELVGEAIAGAAAVPNQKVSSDRNPKRSNLRRVHAELVKVESIADSMDDDNPNGVFNRVLIRGATDAANKKTELTESVLKPLSALYLDMDKAQRKRLLTKVEVPEFINSETGEPTTFTRMELLAVALNTGNESNLDKMLRGEGWSQAALDTVLERELNEQDWQFVQGVWDRIDTLWPEIARVERELTGVVPEKVEPRAVQTRFGTLRGGYYPLVYDANHPRANERVRDNAAKDAEQFFGQHGRNVGTPKGHTIQRTDFAGPLLYSVEGVLFNHVARVTTRIAYGRYIRDALKFTRDGRIRNLVRQKLGQEMLDQIDPWLRRQVNEAAMNTRDIRGWEQALRQFRINATMVGLGFRFTTMQAQVAGLNNSAGLIGPKWVATGMAEWMSKRGEAKRAVFEASPEMARRAEEFDRDVAAAFRQMSGKASKLDGVRAMAFWGIGQIDVHMVAIPTWLGAYRKGLSEGMNEVDAAAYGDKVVRITQAAGRAKDLASLQDSGEGWRVATMFYSYFNALYQQQRIAVRSALRGDYRKAAQITFYTMIAAPLMSALLVGDWPGEDEDWGDWALTRIFFGLWAGIPFVRDAASGGQQFVSGKARNLKDALDKADNPVIRATVSLGSLADDFYKGAHDGEMPDKWLRHAIETPGYFVGLPSGQPAATADYLYGIAEGKQRPQDLGDFGYGVMKGRQKDQE